MHVMRSVGSSTATGSVIVRSAPSDLVRAVGNIRPRTARIAVLSASASAPSVVAQPRGAVACRGEKADAHASALPGVDDVDGERRAVVVLADDPDDADRFCAVEGGERDVAVSVDGGQAAPHGAAHRRDGAWKRR
jgi:trehalose-6-phosphatase